MRLTYGQKYVGEAKLMAEAKKKLVLMLGNKVVTPDKIADKAITADKLADDIICGLEKKRAALSI